MPQPEPEPGPAWGSLSTPEADAAYEAEFGFRPDPPGRRVWEPGDFPDPEPMSTPYELWLTDDPQATWDDPNLAGPADRTVSDRAADLEADWEPELEP
jgi:hypothetical protein